MILISTFIRGHKHCPKRSIIFIFELEVYCTDGHVSYELKKKYIHLKILLLSGNQIFAIFTSIRGNNTFQAFGTKPELNLTSDNELH